MITVLMMQSKMVAVDFLKMKVFQNKGCEVIVFLHDVINTFLSRGSNYIVYVIMGPKFDSSCISMKEVMITSTL